MENGATVTASQDESQGPVNGQGKSDDAVNHDGQRQDGGLSQIEGQGQVDGQGQIDDQGQVDCQGQVEGQCVVDGQGQGSTVNSCSSLSPTSSSDTNFFHSNTDAIDEILADFPENTSAAPRAEMEGDSSDEDPAFHAKKEPPQDEDVAVRVPSPPLAIPAPSSVQTEDTVQMDYVQHKVFAVHFSLSASAVDITPTGSDRDDEPITFIDNDDRGQVVETHYLLHNGATLSQTNHRQEEAVGVNGAGGTLATGNGVTADVKLENEEGSMEEDGDEGLSGAVILSSKIENAGAGKRNGENHPPSSSSSASPSSTSPDDTMYVYEVRRSGKDRPEDGSAERMQTTRVYIRFSGQTVDGLIEHEDELLPPQPQSMSIDAEQPPTASLDQSAATGPSDGHVSNDLIKQIR